MPTQTAPIDAQLGEGLSFLEPRATRTDKPAVPVWIPPHTGSPRPLHAKPGAAR